MTAKCDSIRLAVTPADSPAAGGFQVQVFVNDVDMTAAGAGLGMDPYDVFVPGNRLIADELTRTVPIARCACGDYGCGMTDAAIVRDGHLVRWDWLKETPMERPAVFFADEYDAEVARAGADFSWETPTRTAGRLVLTGLDRGVLEVLGLRPTWVADDYRDPEQFIVTVQSDEHQVFVRVPWRGRSPEELARVACATLRRPPGEWPATWHAFNQRTTKPPRIGPDWPREQFR